MRLTSHKKDFHKIFCSKRIQFESARERSHSAHDILLVFAFQNQIGLVCTRCAITLEYGFVGTMRKRHERNILVLFESSPLAIVFEILIFARRRHMPSHQARSLFVRQRRLRYCVLVPQRLHNLLKQNAGRTYSRLQGVLHRFARLPFL